MRRNSFSKRARLIEFRRRDLSTVRRMRGRRASAHELASRRRRVSAHLLPITTQGDRSAMFVGAEIRGVAKSLSRSNNV